MRLRFFAAFALLFATSVTASGQVVGLPGSTETNQPPIIPFLEGTDVFWTIQGEDPTFPNLLEADLFPHLVASQNFSSTLDVVEQSRRGIRRFKEFSYSISGTPAVRLRMLRDVSAPVRTPSYMPRVNAQFLWTRGLKDCDPSSPKGECRAVEAATLKEAPAAVVEEARALVAVPRVSVWEAHLIIGHHSNGQDGCLMTTQTRVPPTTGECVPPGTVTAATINRIDGSFSTNYVRTGINYSRNWMESHFEATREARVKVEVEHHPRAWIDDEIEELYGRTRLNTSAAYATRHVRLCQRRFEGTASLIWNPGVVETVTEFSTSVQASCFPFRGGGWGFFVRYYRGQDYYNLGFLDEISRVHVGATFNQGGFFSFRRPPPESR